VRGRVIPHARVLAPALASISLPIAMVRSALGTASVTASCAAAAVATGELGAARAAVHVPSIAGGADPERILAARAHGQPADRVLCHRRPPNGRRLPPRRRPRTCDNPSRASRRCLNRSHSSTEGSKPELRALTCFWARSLRDPPERDAASDARSTPHRRILGDASEPGFARFRPPTRSRPVGPPRGGRRREEDAPPPARCSDFFSFK